MEINFSQKTVFITGGNSGIGSTITNYFRESGAFVIAPDSKKLDLANMDCIEEYLKKYSYDYPDILIHCAGVNKLSGIEEINEKEMAEIFQVNFFSFVSLLKCFIPEMKKKTWGRVVAISSLYGIVSKERRIPYSSSKHAINGLIKSVALEAAAKNILINAVAPGYVLTKMTHENLSDSEIKEIESFIPTGRFQKPEEIASLCCFLCSECNQSITGQTIPVDGGFLCQ